jgi:flagellar protein FliL
MATITEAPVAEDAAGKPEKVKKIKIKKVKTKKVKGEKKSKKKLIIIVLVLVLAGAGAYVMLGKGKKPAAPPAPVAGTVLALDSVTLNLADGRYLKLGMALQFTKEASVSGEGTAPLDGSKALDLAIAQLSDRQIISLNSAAARSKAKATLMKAITKAYDGAVMDVYFTEFVMQ